MNVTGKFTQVIQHNWYVRHILFWIFIWNYFALGMGMSGKDFTWVNVMTSYMRQLRYLPGFIMVVYILIYFLIPKFLQKKKFLLFILGFVILIFGLGGYYANLMGLKINDIRSYTGFDFIKGGRNMLPFIHVAGVATAVKLIKQAYFQENIALQAKQQKTIAELELLKAQIHPHFLFNTLNNLFAHTLRNSEDAPNIVSKLSELLKFMIYESQDEFITVTNEIALLKNYIDLEKLRYGDELLCTTTVTGNPEGKWIRPLLLIPLVENCFKHGLSQQLEKRWILLDINITIDKMSIRLANSKSLLPKYNSQRSPGGIGLANVKRRLGLLYPGNHTLEIANEGNKFTVLMEVPLKTSAPLAVSQKTRDMLSETATME